MNLEQWLALCLVCLLGAASPGPSLAVVLQATLAGSRKAGIATALGHASGVALYALLTAGGLGVLVTRAPELYTAIRLTGAIYLLFRAYGAWDKSHVDASTAASQPGGTGFVRGALVALLNPKLAIFMLALFSQFLEPDAGWLYAATLIATVGGIDALWYTAIVFTTSVHWIQRGLARRALALNRGFALLLAALATWVIASTLLP